MKLEGNHSILASRERVFEVLTDPEVLARCMPGCEKLQSLEDGSYELTISAGVGPIRGSYSGSVRLEDIQPPSHYRMVLDVKGKTGFVKGDGTVDLREDGEGTVILYSGNVQVGGPVAAVGQRLHLSAAKMMTRQLFGAIEAEATAGPGEEIKHGIVRNIVRGSRKT